jgi:hypothetical protein
MVKTAAVGGSIELNLMRYYVVYPKWFIMK